MTQPCKNKTTRCYDKAKEKSINRFLWHSLSYRLAKVFQVKA